MTLFEVPPPGAGFVTVTAGVPTVAMSAAKMETISWVELTKVVVLAAPPKLTVDVPTKLVPFTVSVNPDPPATALDGESVVMLGDGLLIVNGKFADGPPPGAGLLTVTATIPAVAM